MTYLLKHSRSSRNPLKTILIFVIIAVSVVLVSFGPIKSFLFGSLSPLFGVGSGFYNKFEGIKIFFTDKTSLSAENENLKNEVETLRLLNLGYEAIKTENEKLKAEIGLKPAEDFISARIIARPPQLPLDSLFIDRGVGDSVHVGSLVLASEKILIGRVAETSYKSGIVVLNSSPRMVSYGSIERTGEPIEMEGIGGGMRARVPIDFDIKDKDRVIVEGLDSYVAAIVGSVEENQSSGLKEILFYLPADISKIKIIFVEPLSRSAVQ